MLLCKYRWGIGAVGAPNVAYHPFLHFARRYVERARLGHTENLALRVQATAVGFGPTGCSSRKVNYRTAIKNDVEALQAVRDYGAVKDDNGKVPTIICMNMTGFYVYQHLFVFFMLHVFRV